MSEAPGGRDAGRNGDPERCRAPSAPGAVPAQGRTAHGSPALQAAAGACPGSFQGRAPRGPAAELRVLGLRSCPEFLQVSPGSVVWGGGKKLTPRPPGREPLRKEWRKRGGDFEKPSSKLPPGRRSCPGHSPDRWRGWAAPSPRRGRLTRARPAASKVV